MLLRGLEGVVAAFAADAGAFEAANVLFMASGLLGVLGMSDQEWERAGERGELPSGEPEVASPVEQRSTATA
jgi:hypothetical protein